MLTRVLRIIPFLMLCLCLSVYVSAQDASIGSDYFVEAVVSNATPFVGEQVIYSFRLYTAVQLPPASYSPPDFEGFWRTDMGPNTSTEAQINGRLYSVTQRDTALFANAAGEITIDPSQLILPATVFEDGEVLTTESVALQVRPLPAGAPDNFGGAVGQLNMSATIDHQTRQQGEPFTLRLSISGTANIEQLTAPEFPLPDGWRVYQNPADYQSTVQNGVLVGEKVFEWLLAPGTSGTLPLPEITLSYFDPVNLAYRTVNTGSVTLEVLPADESSGAAPIAEAAVLAPALPLKALTTPLAVGGSGITPAFWALWLIPPAALAVGWWWMRQQHVLLRPNPNDKSTKALARARRSLQTARKLGDGAGHKAVKDVVLAYFKDRLEGTPVNVDSMADLQTVMDRHGINEQLQGRLLTCLELADSGIYAPTPDTDMELLVDRTTKVLIAVDAAWKQEPS